MKKPESKKEQGLVKGAMRRVFSRSEVRLDAIKRATVVHHDPDRPRVTRWVFCNECGLIFPAYQAQVDHREPLIEVGKSLEDYTWDEIADRLWCDISNLNVMDKDCHKLKSRLESKERRRIKNEQKK